VSLEVVQLLSKGYRLLLVLHLELLKLLNEDTIFKFQRLGALFE
jgi:hypothetical protein